MTAHPTPTEPNHDVREEWAARLQCADVGVDFPWLTEDGCDVWHEQSEAAQEHYRRLLRVALSAGLQIPPTAAVSAAAPAGRDRHPEDYCHRCGGPNVSWWVPSPVWNAVMGYPDQAHDGIVCPRCFAELAEARGAKGPWRWAPREWPQGVSLVHTDGRVWDATTERWIERAPSPRRRRGRRGGRSRGGAS